MSVLGGDWLDSNTKAKTRAVLSDKMSLRIRLLPFPWANPVTLVEPACRSVFRVDSEVSNREHVRLGINCVSRPSASSHTDLGAMAGTMVVFACSIWHWIVF